MVKIVRVCPAPGYLAQFRARHKLRDRSFAEQISTLRAQNVLLPGGWAKAMEQQGFEVFEVLYPDAGLQARWAIENGCQRLLHKPEPCFEILKEQIRVFQPDVLFLYAGAFFVIPRHLRSELRALVAKPMILTGMWGDELHQGHTYRDYFGDLDLVFCSSSAYQKHFEDAGIAATTIGNCFDDTIEYRRAEKKTHDFIFCGTTGYGYFDHIGRYEKLIALMSGTGLEVWAQPECHPLGLGRSVFAKAAILNGAAGLPAGVLRALQRWSGGRIGRLAGYALRVKASETTARDFLDPNGNPLARYFDGKKPLRRLFPRRIRNPPLDTSDYYSLLAGSKIVLNLHRDEDADIGNVRCFEATGLGACLLTDRGEELREFFDVDNDLVSFSSTPECIEKLDYLLAHPEEIERIARNGQRTTLARHTVAHRCRTIAATLAEYAASPRAKQPLVVLATYDIDKHPISYDIAFFLQAAEIHRRQIRAQGIIFNILFPTDIDRMPGVPAHADAVVDAEGRDFRLHHICLQVAQMMPSMGVISARDRRVEQLVEAGGKVKIVDYPPQSVAHHSAYYRTVRDNPELLAGWSASAEAHRYVGNWLDPLLKGRRLLCITLRQYLYDPQRNSDMAEWAAFLERIDEASFLVVVIPDTDHIAAFRDGELGRHACFEPACFDVDLRLALYERAYLNMSVNTGPIVAAGLDKKVRYLLFKVLAEGVPHCSREFLAECGFEYGQSPAYAGPYQKWVWEEDRRDVLWREFSAMAAKLDAPGGAP